MSETQWFLEAELLAEIDEEYRRKNRAFRRFVKRTIAADENHPLRFLLTAKGGYRRDARTPYLMDAGHVVPVRNLTKAGTTLERLVVQQRSLNRSAGAKPVTRIVKVAGIPVDVESLRLWSKTVPGLAAYLSAPTSRGWSSKTGKVLELEFVLSLPGQSLARRAAA